MESSRSDEDHFVMYGINPKEKCTLMRDAMPPRIGGFHAPHFAR